MITVELPAFLLRSDRLQVQVGLPLLPRLPAYLTCLACCKCIFTIGGAAWSTFGSWHQGGRSPLKSLPGMRDATLVAGMMHV